MPSPLLNKQVTREKQRAFPPTVLLAKFEKAAGNLRLSIIRGPRCPLGLGSMALRLLHYGWRSLIYWRLGSMVMVLKSRITLYSILFYMISLSV